MMNDEYGQMDDRRDGKGRRPLQFGLKTVLGLVFGTLRGLKVSPQASALVLMIFIASVLAALALVIAIAAAADNDEGE